MTKAKQLVVKVTQMALKVMRDRPPVTTNCTFSPALAAATRVWVGAVQSGKTLYLGADPVETRLGR